MAALSSGEGDAPAAASKRRGPQAAANTWAPVQPGGPLCAVCQAVFSQGISVVFKHLQILAFFPL